MTMLALLILLWLLPSLVFIGVAMLAIPSGAAVRRLRRAALAIPVDRSGVGEIAGVGELGR